MSDLPSSRRLKPNTSQLPISWYFDPQVFELEQKLLFASSPGYVGHELMVPNAGDYHTLAWMDHGKVLVRNANGIELMSNVCRHRQAILLEGRGNAQNIVCPLHRWTYDMKGELLGAPHFPENPCLNLGKTPLQNWRGMLFAGKRDVAKDLAGFASADDFDFSGYMLDRVEILEFEQNWKTFIEVYLEDYHVIPYHPGLGNFVTCDDLKWDIALVEREFVEAEQAAYRETAIEDDEIARRMDRGRRALWERGENEAGPYQSPMEDGMMHFHEHIKRGLARHL